MYSQQLLRVTHDEWLRHAEARRMVKQARAEARETARPCRRQHSAPFDALRLPRRVRHA